jgi:hypothetical protein
MVAYVYNPNYSGGRGRRIQSSRPDWKKLARSYLKKSNKNKGARGVAQELVHWRSMCKALVYIPSTEQNKTKGNKTKKERNKQRSKEGEGFLTSMVSRDGPRGKSEHNSFL